MEPIQWSCPKCGGTSCERDEMRATGGVFAKIFDVQNKRFTTLTCTHCRFTELYKASSSQLGNIFDFFTN